jgi:beta-lactamase class A
LDENEMMRPLAPLAAVLIVCGLAMPANAESISGRFIDDDGLPGELHIERLAELGAVHGCNPPANTESCPDRKLSRAEAFKVLVAAAQAFDTVPEIPPSLPSHFSDDDHMWGGAASRYSDFLASLELIHGCNPPANTHVCPDEHLSRAEVAKITVGTFGLTAPVDYETPWIDTAGRWFDETARVAAFHHLFDFSDGRFDGREKIDRAEFARVVVTGAGEDLCTNDPFTRARVSGLESRYPSQAFTAYAYDTRTGCAYWMNPNERLRTASVFKVLVMAGTLLEAQEDDRSLSSWERDQLEPMITQSANAPVRALWRSFGGSPWFRRQADNYGLDETSPVGDTEGVWGRTTTSAKDQADVIRQVLLGDWGPLEEPYREEAWDLMTSVVSSQTWGITEGVPSDWTVAQKNGFAGDIANSVGFVQEPGSAEGYVIAVLTNWWSDWERGVPVVEEIAGWVSSELAN